MLDKTQKFNLIINNIMRIAKSASTRNEKLTKICQSLKEHVPYYDWVGFYIADESEKELTLGPFAGEPTEHIKIPFGKGVCGQAVAKKETVVVQDVSSETNYLSCSPMVRSEMVVPIIKNDKVMGELDIDSHTHAPFTDEDKKFLEDVINIVTQLL